MSNAKHETLAEIVADMRELAADIETGNAVVGQTVWRNYADRIEVALSTPPRNCDRPECATAKSAQDVWHMEDVGK